MGGEKYWNITNVILDINKCPQTYKTILCNDYNDGTCQILVRRKLNTAVKNGEILKSSIPGTRFGECIFYTIDKKYYILVESDRLFSKVYYFFNYEKINKFFIEVKECWLLKNYEWVEQKNKTFFQGKVLLFI
jgi:hypothetical protein